MLLKWKEQQGSDATYQKLCDVLTEIGNKDRADKVHQLTTKGNKAAHIFPHANLLCTWQSLFLTTTYLIVGVLIMDLN